MRKPRKSKTTPRRYDVEKLTDQEIRNEFVVKIGGVFEALIDRMENQTVQKAYEEYVNTTNKITEETVGYKKKKQVEGMPKALENKCNDRREARLKYLKQPSNNELRENYRTINRQVKSEVLQQKRLTMEKKVEQLERDFKNNNSHNLFKTVRELEKKPYRQLNTIKDKNGTIQCEQEEVLRCWQDHFTTQLNTEFPHNDEAPNDVLEGDVEINDNPPTEHEVETSIKSLKNKKSPGWDNITAEVLKAGGRYMVEMLQCLFKKVWDLEDTPDDWSKLLINPIHKKAFDTVWREALWIFLSSVGVNQRMINVIKKMYENTQCSVMIGGSMTEWFCVRVGVRQGCILSPALFNLFLEFVMRELKSIDRELNYREKMSLDIRYADDTTLLSVIFGKLGLSTQELETACMKWGLKINNKKCKILTDGDDNIRIDGEEVQRVNEFVFLGSMLPFTSKDVNRRIALASAAFGRLQRTVWSRRDISLKLKVRLYKSLILPIAIYAGETWTLRAEDTRRLEVFEMRCLRAIMGIRRIQRVTNEHIRRELNVNETITEIIRRKRLKWFGHTMRRPPESYIRRAYWGDFTARRPRGRPPKRWKDQIPEDLGLPLHRCEEMALNRGDWWEGAVRGRRRARGRYDLRP
ncbi:hypothetical protein Pcinc_012338 [Petrolisthes cinctipes]|uniref:Reverse transcriptase domain-containing protein n=1 Tax=Petrolisthes cinctipes TaxID=88211 RepID=A0AAE1G0V5_PETCI|nr:hypothetical protein Pcinc_012338 [Petrolisthes cinctipes]